MDFLKSIEGVDHCFVFRCQQVPDSDPDSDIDDDPIVLGLYSIVSRFGL